MVFRRFAAVAMCWLALGAAITPAHAGKYQVLYSFPGTAGGVAPYYGLLELNGLLYGATVVGGSADAGTVFSFDPSTSTETVLHSLNGTTDGSGPQYGLVAYEGFLYGGARGAGRHGDGTLFSVDPSSKAFKTLYSFGKKPTDGRSPAGLQLGDGKIYGATADGPGSSNYGTVFVFNPAKGKVKTLYGFDGTDGTYPFGEMGLAHGMLYGTTSAGGSGFGTVFAVNPRTRVGSVIYAFKGGTDASFPQAGLIKAGGLLYGTSSGGGAHHGGTIFSINPETGAETIVYSFQDPPDGSTPYSSLVEVHGKLYGTTIYGGDTQDGTIFAFDLAKGTEKVVHSFEGGSDGVEGGVLMVNVNGTLYGTTPIGGTANHGTIYSYTP